MLEQAEKFVNTGIPVAIGDCCDQSLPAGIEIEALLDLGARRARARRIRLVEDNDVSGIEHDNFLQLKPASVFGTHYEHALVHQFAREGKRFLADSDRFDEHDVEFCAFERSKPRPGFRRESASRATGGEATHEDAVIL